MANTQYDFGMIGLGVMGQNLLLNMADHGFAVIGFDKDLAKGSTLESKATPGTTVKGVGSMQEMVQGLKTPRKMIMLVPAGKPVDDVIESVLPFLEKGDVVIDGGNSYFADTLRRVKYVEEKGFHFMGMGVSGGESGARSGPAIMPGGDVEAWNEVKPVLEAISAKVNGEPCVAYMGKDAAGHYVKMVHNGIEYAIMQLISETYDILKRRLGLDNNALHEVFTKWNEGPLKSYLIEITAQIFTKKDTLTDGYLVDMILDKAGSKGTGKWTSQEAMNLGIATPNIDMAVAMRTVSAFKDERIKAHDMYQPFAPAHFDGDKDKMIAQIGSALFASIIICYAQGLSMLTHASADLKMYIPMQDAVKVWRGGCIIRSVLLETFYAAYQANPQLSNILLDEKMATELKANVPDLRLVATDALQNGIGATALCAALTYFDNYTNDRMPVNLLQAQRDFFGSHTYQRIDIPGIFHTEWER